MFKNILVPTDGSDNAQRAVEVALDFIKKYGEADTRVTVMYVSTGAIHPNFWPARIHTEEDYNKLLAHEGKVFTEKAVNVFKEDGVEVEVVNPIGDPGTEIVKWAEENGADIVIMGARGAAGFSAWVIGSVANKVVSRAPCPVLLVHEDY